ncbi:MAG TPA: iron-containing alcohol dehydrogenase [Gaiellaceae bacterium]|nr:iron-containing alcohol dehydrogenase [Gaiellaceae bacterium]
MIVRWGLDALGELIERYSAPLLVSTERWRELDLPVTDRFHGVRPHAERAGVEEAVARAQTADALVGLGGGSAIDTAKAVSAATGLPLVAVPTTYAGAEWTPYFGIRDEARRMKGGGSGADTVAIVYEPKLTLDLPRGESGGTAMNALAHCVEAMYVADSDEARKGAALIDEWLPRVLDDGHDETARGHLLEGAMYAGIALRDHGLYLGHAMAQALGGRYGLPHGALNAIVLPAAMRFNGATEPLGVERVEELARLAGFTRLRDLGVPEDELGEVAAATAVRGGAQANPRPASPAQIEELLRSVW